MDELPGIGALRLEMSDVKIEQTQEEDRIDVLVDDGAVFHNAWVLVAKMAKRLMRGFKNHIILQCRIAKIRFLYLTFIYTVVRGAKEIRRSGPANDGEGASFLCMGLYPMRDEQQADYQSKRKISGRLGRHH